MIYVYPMAKWKVRKGEVLNGDDECDEWTDESKLGRRRQTAWGEQSWRAGMTADGETCVRWTRE